MTAAISWTRLLYWSAATVVGLCALLQSYIDSEFDTIRESCQSFQSADIHAYFAFRKSMGIGQILIHVLILGPLRICPALVLDCLRGHRATTVYYYVILPLCNLGILYVVWQSLATIITLTFDCPTWGPAPAAGFSAILALELTAFTILVTVLGARLMAISLHKTAQWFPPALG
jgi:hypothetical protein